MNTPINPYHGAKASVRFLDVAEIEKLLGSNIEHQRKVSRNNLAKLESDMKHDRFHLTGEPIIIGRSGKLLDGQHRCIAGLNVRRGFWTVVVEGIEDDLFHVINTGKSRSLSDVLKIAGEKDAPNLSTTLIRLTEYTRSSQSVGSTQAAVSTSEAFDVLNMLPRVRESVAYCRTLGDVVAASRSAWLHCVTQDACPRLSDEFFSKLASGEMLPTNSPIYLLRARLISEKQGKARLPLVEVLALMVKAWNAHVEGRPLKNLKWAVSEQFPVLHLPSKTAA